MKPSDLVTLDAFLDALVIEADGKLVRLGPRLDPFQREDFAALAPAIHLVTGKGGKPTSKPKQRAWLERPRGHSKTNDQAAITLYALLASHRPLSIVAAAGDKDQAKLLLSAVAKLVRFNRLEKYIDVQTYRAVNVKSGSTLDVLSSDAPTSFGLTPDMIVCDEVSHWGRRDLWDSLLSSAAKRARCFLVVITNAGYGGDESWQWVTREIVRRDPAWHFNSLDGPQASWIKPEFLDEQRRLLPAIAYDRLWGNIWTSGAGDALRESDIDAALTLDGPATRPERGKLYFAGVDLGWRRDNTAVVVVSRDVGWTEHKQGERKKTLHGPLAAMADLGLIEVARTKATPIACHHAGTHRLAVVASRAWKPAGGQTLDLNEVESHIVSLHEKFGLSCVAFDPTQAVQMMTNLKRRGIQVMSVDQTGPNLKAICTEMLSAFSDRQIDLYRGGQLLADLRNLRVEERSFGCRLTSPRGSGGHGDRASALGIGLLAARRGSRMAARINRPFLADVYQ